MTTNGNPDTEKTALDEDVQSGQGLVDPECPAMQEAARALLEKSSRMWEGVDWNLVKAQSSGPRVELEMPTQAARDDLQNILKGHGIIGLAKGDRDVTELGGPDTRVYQLVVNAAALEAKYPAGWQPEGGTVRRLAA